MTNENPHSDKDLHDFTSDTVGSRKNHKHVKKKTDVTNNTASNLKLFSTNGAGVIGGKIGSLKAQVSLTKANVVTLQETHARRKGRIQIPDMVVFEAVRKAKGGGTLIASHKSLNPRLVESYEEEFELLVVEIEVKDRTIRVISGYGPQENWPEEKRRPFFVALETEVEKANLAGKSIIIELDANAKLGKKYIPNDPHEISPNGTILATIVERQGIVVGNGTNICQGTITRTRVTRDRTEKSAIDLLMYSSDLHRNLVSLIVDEKRKHVISKVIKTKKGPKLQESDHNPIIAEFDLKLKDSEGNIRTEIYNFKDKEGLERFKKCTSSTNMLSSVFNSKEDINILTHRFLKKLNGCLAMSFKKVRIDNNKRTDKIQKLHDKMANLKKDNKSKEEIDQVVNDIAEEAEDNYRKIKEELDKVKTNKGGMNSKQIWSLKKALCPKSKDPPTAMLDSKGNLLTTDEAIQNRAVEVFADRLNSNKIDKHLTDLEEDTNKLCQMRLKLSKLNKTQPWSIEDLKYVLKKLPRNKARDSHGYANELFAPAVAGDDLQKALLLLLNRIKEKQEYPKALQDCNITTIYKKKARNDFNNYRGIFRISVIRSILDRLIYEDSYEVIDSNLTDGNVGCRQNRSSRDNIFVIGAITNSVINGDSRPIQIQIMDIKTCFDKLWLEASINSLYENGLKSDKLNLLYIENKNANVAVKVNNKVSKRFPVKNVVMQGSVWGGLKCTSQMDTLNKAMKSKDSLMYKYKGDPSITIGVLGMVDDTLGVSECGAPAVEKNAVINSFVETHRLKMHEDKSCVIHVGNVKKCEQTCPSLKVHSQNMHDVKSSKYLGNVLTSSGGVRETISDRRNKGWGKVAQILGILGEVPLGQYRIEVGLLLRKAILTSALLYSAEAWSAVSETEIRQLEQVDSALLKGLVEGHSKTPSCFHYLETGSLMLRHIIKINRVMYHHHILGLDRDETVRKIYEKQKEATLKGDWFNLLKTDFEFMNINFDEQEIKRTPKETYRKKINDLIKRAAFKELLEMKNSKSKTKDLKYETFYIQPYLKCPKFNNSERKLLYSLRSRMHPARNNFKKLHSSNLTCSLGCNSNEDQRHIFENCEVLKSNLSMNMYDYIFLDKEKQKEAISIFIILEERRKELLAQPADM